MKLVIYSVFDKSAQAYATPFFMENDQVAIRAVEASLSDSNSMLNKYPGDYVLHRLGAIDMETGHILVVGPDDSLIVAQIAELKQVNMFSGDDLKEEMQAMVEAIGTIATEVNTGMSMLHQKYADIQTSVNKTFLQKLLGGK